MHQHKNTKQNPFSHIILQKPTSFTSYTLCKLNKSNKKKKKNFKILEIFNQRQI